VAGSQEALSKTIFPLGELTKAETRNCKKNLLKLADTPDSQKYVLFQMMITDSS
jgi:tRNA U34 2-thiouridine synthase MnmA/TrmU